MTTTKMHIMKAAAYAAIILSLSGAAMSAHASTPSFSFLSVEYKPMDERLPAAKAFLAAYAAPGDDLQAAETAIRRAGADCRPDHGKTGEIQCSLTADIRKTGDHLDEVTWRVQIDPTAGGKIASASASRDVLGF